MLYKGINIGEPGKEDDKQVVDEVQRYLKWIDVKDLTVFDIGAHYGAFTVRALEAGAKEVIAFEPNPTAFTILTQNMVGRKNYIAFQSAVGLTNGTTTLNFHTRYSSAASVTKKYKGKADAGSIQVNTLRFRSLLSDYRPSVLKLDCEGSEFDLLLSTRLPKYVKQVFAEIHLNTKENRSRFDALLKVFDSDHTWQTIRRPKPNWPLVFGCWKRV